MRTGEGGPQHKAQLISTRINNWLSPSPVAPLCFASQMKDPAGISHYPTTHADWRGRAKRFGHVVSTHKRKASPLPTRGGPLLLSLEKTQAARSQSGAHKREEARDDAAGKVSASARRRMLVASPLGQRALRFPASGAMSAVGLRSVRTVASEQGQRSDQSPDQGSVGGASAGRRLLEVAGAEQRFLGRPREPGWDSRKEGGEELRGGLEGKEVAAEGREGEGNKTEEGKVGEERRVGKEGKEGKEGQEGRNMTAFLENWVEIQGAVLPKRQVDMMLKKLGAHNASELKASVWYGAMHPKSYGPRIDQELILSMKVRGNPGCCSCCCCWY